MYKYKGYRVTLMACSECNQKCEHCYISYSGHRDSKELNNLVKLLSKKYRVKINGSEVLINPEYLESYSNANQNFILTNGLEIYRVPMLLEKIKENGIKKIYMSYHFGMHEKISNIPKEVIMENIRNIHNYKLKVYIMTTLSKLNYNLINDICDSAYNLDVDGIIFNNYLLQGNAETDYDLILNEEDIKSVALMIEESRFKYKREQLDICKCGSLGPNHNSNHNNFKCIAGIDQAVITPDNKVYPCFFLAKPGYEIGYFDGKDVIITNPIVHDGSECISYKILNKKLKNQYYK